MKTDESFKRKTDFFPIHSSESQAPFRWVFPRPRPPAFFFSSVVTFFDLSHRKHWVNHDQVAEL